MKNEIKQKLYFSDNHRILQIHVCILCVYMCLCVSFCSKTDHLQFASRNNRKILVLGGYQVRWNELTSKKFKREFYYDYRNI
jgi:hypothetical protein